MSLLNSKAYPVRRCHAEQNALCTRTREHSESLNVGIHIPPHPPAQSRSGDHSRFYERMFGAEVIRSSHDGKTRIDMKVGGANVFIAPVAPESGVNPAPTTPYEGLDHFGLRVSGVDHMVAELKAKGAQFTMEPTTIRPGVRIAFLRGPEGVSIELVDPTAS